MMTERVWTCVYVGRGGNTGLYESRIQGYTSQEYRVIQVKNTELYESRIQSYTSQEYRVIQEHRAHLYSNVVAHIMPDVDEQGQHREGHFVAAEGDLTPHDDEGEESKEDGTDSVHPGPEPHLPVPLWRCVPISGYASQTHMDLVSIHTHIFPPLSPSLPLFPHHLLPSVFFKPWDECSIKAAGAREEVCLYNTMDD